MGGTLRGSTILVVTGLYPNQEIPFLGSFVESQVTALSRHYRVVVIVPVSVKIGFRKKIVHISDNLHIYFIPQYATLPVTIFSYLLEKGGVASSGTALAYKKYCIGRATKRVAKRLHRKYHFAIVHGHESYVGDEAAAIGLSLSIPAVVTIHHLYEYHLQLFGEYAMRKVMLNLFRASKVIAVSDMVVKSYHKNGLPTGLLEVIPNGIDSETKGLLLPEKWKNIAENKILILGVGFYIHAKRLEQIIYACVQLKKKYGNSFILFLVGMGHLAGFYEEIIKNTNLEGHVFLVGALPPDEVKPFFRACDLVVHPSVWDSFSMVCLEAMQAGKPFICTRNAGITEYITDREAFVVPADDIGELIDKMDILIGDKKLRESMGRAGLELAEKFYWKNVLPRIKKVYDDLGRT